MLKVILPISFTVIFTTGLLFAGFLGKKLNFEISTNGYINGQFNYQIILLLIHRDFHFGNLLAQPAAISVTFSPLAGYQLLVKNQNCWALKKGDSWLKTGVSLSFVITAVTAIFMYFQLKQASRRLVCFARWYFMDNTFFAYKFIW
jgi:hypothetical protein